MNKTLELLKLFEKFGIKPGKIIGAGDRNVVPIKKPILTKPLNRDYLLEDVEGGKIGINTVQNEIGDIAPLFFQKKLNDVDINNIVNNLNYLDKLLNPTNVLDITTKQPVKGLESLRPTIATELEKTGKQLEQKGKELEQASKPDINAVLQDFAQAQKAYQLAQKSGYVRATAREIMREDILSKKLKLPKEVENEILNGLGNPIDVFRKAYGEDALEQLDSLGPVLGQFKTETDAARIARRQFNFQPKKIEVPETTTIEEAKKAEQVYGLNPKTAEVVDMPEKSLMDKIKDIFTRKKAEPAEVKNIKLEIDKRKSIDDLIDEYNANQDRMSLTDEEGGTLISYDEFNKLNRRNREIADALENKGISSKVEEEVKPEGIVIPFKKKITEPEEKAEGGIIRTKFAGGGKGKKILGIIEEANKKLKGKKSMETVNPKTGEVTVPEKPVGLIMEPEPVVQKYDKDIMKAANEVFPDYNDPKIAADQIVDSYAQMKFGLEDASSLSSEEQMKLYNQAYNYVMDYNRGAFKLTAPVTSKEIDLEKEMNMVLNQYDKSMFIKDQQGMVDVSNPENVKRMALLLRENHPELYKRLEGLGSQLNEIENFDITGRKPNAEGGIAGLL